MPERQLATSNKSRVAPSTQSPSLVASASLAAAVGALSLSLLGLAAPETAAAAATADVIAASAAVPAGVSGILDLADFQAGFASAFLLVLFSEIGDKTFFIAAVLATRRPNLEVFAGTFGALAVMTVLSVALGRIFHYADELLPAFGSFDFPLDDVASVVLLVFFGLSTLRDAAGMDSKAEEEQQEAEKAVAGLNAAEGTEGGISLAVLASVFALVFTAEWGDKSFFSTIALAAASSPAGVVTGAVAAHGVATVMAVLGGSFLSKYISEKPTWGALSFWSLQQQRWLKLSPTALLLDRLFFVSHMNCASVS
ncbi:unnamed protein product [Closterium sp. NIES-64]|nr:unnamed protein product [Closterium sp. NIES-64]CAI6004390.1 unnamed protein product [Closterium sp. NIES-64]